MKVAITGANGYVGSRIKDYLAQKGWEIVELGRKPAQRGAPFIPYALGQTPKSDSLRGVEGLVHCAYDFKAAGWNEMWRINVQGSQKLFDSAKQAGVKRLIHISSISAFDGCASLYGRAKLETEQEAFKFGATVIRPGLVFGENPGGMVGTLNKLVAKLPLIPVVGKNQIMYLSYEEDLAQLVFRALEGEFANLSKPLIAASPDGLSFGDIIRLLAKRQGKNPLLIPIPWQFAWLGLKSAESMGLKPGLRSDSLISLMNPDPHPDFEQSQRLNILFRDFH